MSRIRKAVAAAAGAALLAASVAAAAPPARESVEVAGKVLETVDSGGYTYMKLQMRDAQKWVAAPRMQVKVGQEVNLIRGYEMTNFTSKTLNRSFDRIIFTLGPAGAKATSDPHVAKMHQDVGNGKTAAEQQTAPPPPPAPVPQPLPPPTPKISKAELKKNQPLLKHAHQSTKNQPQVKGLKLRKPQGGYTVAELYGKKGSLEGKRVTFRGKVTKVSGGILKRNWVHLQDGSGDAKKKTNSVVVTTTALPAMGDTVLASGTFRRNRDFGAGYRYEVIVEDAVLRKE